MLRINCALSWLCTAHRAAASSSSTLSQNLGSSTRASQSGPKCESYTVKTRFAIAVARGPRGHVNNGVHVATWTASRVLPLFESPFGPDWLDRLSHTKRRGNEIYLS